MVVLTKLVFTILFCASICLCRALVPVAHKNVTNDVIVVPWVLLC
jgi:hypothetical protein